MTVNGNYAALNYQYNGANGSDSSKNVTDQMQQQMQERKRVQNRQQQQLQTQQIQQQQLQQQDQQRIQQQAAMATGIGANLNLMA